MNSILSFVFVTGVLTLGSITIAIASHAQRLTLYVNDLSYVQVCLDTYCYSAVALGKVLIWLMGEIVAKS